MDHALAESGLGTRMQDLTRTFHEFEKRCEARQSEIRAGSVLAHVTKRIAAITPPRALVVLRFLLNKPQNTLCFRPKLTTCSHPNSYTRSAETGEIFGLSLIEVAVHSPPRPIPRTRSIARKSDKFGWAAQ